MERTHAAVAAVAVGRSRAPAATVAAKSTRNRSLLHGRTPLLKSNLFILRPARYRIARAAADVRDRHGGPGVALKHRSARSINR